MAVIVHGKAIHRTTTGEAPCAPGQILIIPPGVWHAYAECRDLELFNCLFSPELLDGALAWTAQDAKIGPLLRRPPWQWSSHVLTLKLRKPAIPKLRSLNFSLLRTYEKTGIARPAKLMAELLLLLDHISHESSPASPPPQPVIVHSAVRRAAELLRSDPGRPWALPGLAGELRINPSYLVRLFRQQTGTTPMKFLARDRAHKAAQLLMITDLNVNEIGANVGWAEPKQFARCFRQHFRETATAFRKRLRSER